MISQRYDYSNIKFLFSEELVQEEVAEPIDEDGKGIIFTFKSDKFNRVFVF